MNALDHGRAALADELQRQLAALRERRLWALLAGFALLLFLAAQAPLSYQFDVGLEEGYGSDRPMLVGFHAPEKLGDTSGNLRWTTDDSRVRLPGISQRPLLITLRLLPVNPELAQNGPAEIDVYDGEQRLGALVIRPTSGGSYSLLLPPGGDRELILRSRTYSPTGDARSLGTPVDAIRIASPAGPWLPPLRHDLAWLAAALLAWLALRRIGFAPALAQALIVPAAGLAALAALLDPLRFAFGSSTVLIIAALGWLLVLLLQAAPAMLLAAGALLLAPGLALLRFGQGEAAYWAGAALASSALALAGSGWLRPAIGAIYRRATPALPAPARRWLLLFSLLVFATHYGGKIYPDSMWGDIGFHSNRYGDVLAGNVLLLSRNRGVDFPYPPALYLLLAPFSLAGLDRRVLLQLGGALLDAASPWLIYSIATGLGRRVAGGTAGAAEAGAVRRGLIAAALYSFSAATLMTTWWNFSTHIFTQLTHLLLITTLVALPIAAPADTSPPGARVGFPALAWLFVLQLLVYLGHFGFWMNMSLLGGFGLAVLLLVALRRRAGLALFWSLLGVFVAAELFAALFFYTGYTGLFLAQAQATATGGLTGLANRPATDRALLWNALWNLGLRTHFGFFPVPLALGGLLLIGRGSWLVLRGQAASAAGRVATLMAGTFLIALLFAALPFLSGSTLSTRWLMFSAWAFAVGAALLVQLLWRAGRAGRLVALAMGGYVAWISAAMWLGALAWRIRPPEPF